jgi:hypothetical protein
VLETLLSFEVRAVDGEVMPVPALEVGARFTYPAAASSWSTAVTDGDGCATFRDRHPEAPRQVCLYIGDERCGTFPVKDGASIVLEV